MKVVYGNPKTIMAMGMIMLGDVPTPFFGFTDKAKVEDNGFFTSGPDSAALVQRIEADGGVIIYIENPEAAVRLHQMLGMLFSSASEGPWADLEQVEAEIQ